MIDTEKLIHIRETILYRNDEEKEAARLRCIEDCINNSIHYQNYTVSEFKQILLLDDSEYDFDTQFLVDNFEITFGYKESKRLFDLTCQKYGYKLWNGNAWHNKTCKRNCPLSDFCKKFTVEINGERLCRGQIYSREISEKDLPDDTSIYKQDRSLYITKQQDDQLFSAFFEFSLDIFGFGWSKKGGSQITGGNVIMKLYKDMERTNEKFRNYKNARNNK